MTRLFLTNIPYDCHETELQGWIESQGIQRGFRPPDTRPGCRRLAFIRICIDAR
jgi:hypothetical protein